MKRQPCFLDDGLGYGVGADGRTTGRDIRSRPNLKNGRRILPGRLNPVVLGDLIRIVAINLGFCFRRSVATDNRPSVGTGPVQVVQRETAKSKGATIFLGCHSGNDDRS